MGKQVLRIQAIDKDADAAVLMTSRAIFDGLSQHLPEWMAASDSGKWMIAEDLEDAADAWTPPAITPASLAFLQYTSGSTGIPKGVKVTHANLIHNEQVIQQACRNTQDSVFVVWLPLYHDMGLIGNVLQSVYLGCTTYMMAPVTFIQRPMQWLYAISNFRSTISGGPNFGYELCLQRATDEDIQKLDLSCWDIAYNGAEPVRAHTLEAFARRFEPAGFRYHAAYPCYGMAEATLCITAGAALRTPVITPVDKEALKADRIVHTDREDPASQLLVGCGHTWEGQTVRIVHPETLEACPDDVIGEIWAQGGSICDGYWNRPEESEATFAAYIKDTGEGPFLRTGDLGFLKNGELYITGRLKDLVIIRGQNHYPQDIELTVERSHEALRSGGGAAFSVEVQGEERLVVLQEVEITTLKKVPADELFAAIRKAISLNHELQAYAIVLVRRRSIFKTSSGKVQRRACKQAFLAGELFEEARWMMNT
jgi:acyl-CoA synthetase (AMP-forming)/AMP-acid ligase II